jgi:hypothetical protein
MDQHRQVLEVHQPETLFLKRRFNIGSMRDALSKYDHLLDQRSNEISQRFPGKIQKKTCSSQ